MALTAFIPKATTRSGPLHALSATTRDASWPGLTPYLSDSDLHFACSSVLLYCVHPGAQSHPLMSTGSTEPGGHSTGEPPPHYLPLATAPLPAPW